jgi:methyltransferase (TIGR00027 family)
MEKDFNHISETAHWIAALRAMETERANPVVRDPLAAKLAGEQGFEMARSMPHIQSMSFAMIVRTTAIDRLIESALQKNVDHVINLGAGLDTRPYRLKLPNTNTLNWTEVDYPELISYKEEKLAAETPQCKLQRVGCDLSDTVQRRALFEQLSLKSTCALVITEGVIGYLRNEDAETLSKDIFTQNNFKYWIQDYSQGKMRRHKQANDLRKKMKRVPIQFAVEWPLRFFSSHGWKIEEDIHILDEADRIGKKLPFLGLGLKLASLLFPKRLRKLGNDTYGYVLFSK